MTIKQLQAELEKESLTVEEVKAIIYELKNDCVGYRKESYEAGFYNGQMNAYYIALDLLKKVVT